MLTNMAVFTYAIYLYKLIKSMNKILYLRLDGKLFVTVLEVASVTKAAETLGVSQSAVSHTLDKLRSTFDDPLFVSNGRVIRPTAKAQSLGDPIEAILDCRT
jgi:hypothetical protein